LLAKHHDYRNREANKAINVFRNLHQKSDSRREWDLQDPNTLKKEKPSRINNIDPRCGLASMLKFEGEDINIFKRKKFQQEQAREWLLQQV
jgi:hypothetical protein